MSEAIYILAGLIVLIPFGAFVLLLIFVGYILANAKPIKDLRKD